VIEYQLSPHDLIEASASGFGVTVPNSAKMQSYNRGKKASTISC